MIILTSVAMVGSTAQADEAFVIDSLKVDIWVEPNNLYHISEYLQVNFTEPRHGLIRKLPLRFDRGWVNIKNISVSGAPFSVSRDPESLFIKIGSKEEFIEGSMEYIISYDYEVGADKLPNMDEFYHNVVGVEWDTTIAKVNFEIHMPQSFDSNDVNVTLGRRGSTNNSEVSWTTEGTFITGETKRSLRNFEGLTVAIPLPEGYWQDAKQVGRPTSLLFNWLSHPLQIAVLILTFLVWFVKGRDKKLHPTLISEPPEQMTPAEIGYVIDGSADTKDITALILFWAKKGHLTIEEAPKGKMVLTKCSELEPQAKDFERILFRKLFLAGNGTVVTTDELHFKFYQTANEAARRINQSFEQNPERTLFEKSSTKWQLLVGLLSVLPVTALYLDLFGNVSGKGPLWLIAIIIGIFYMIFSMFLGRDLSGQKNWSLKGSVLIWLLMLALCILPGWLVTYVSGMTWMQYLSATLSSMIAASIIPIVKKRTEYGTQITEKVLGFKQFIQSVDSQQLQTILSVNPSCFYDLLPYAIVLGISDKWSGHFKKLTVIPPTWYIGYRYDRFRTDDFDRNLNRSLGSLSKSISSSPSTSGSSGGSSSGGSAGGGSGGGGGSSW